MKIIIAPDSFKGSATAIEVCDSIEKGIKKVFPNAKTIKLPVADGGEGTVSALVAGTGGIFKEVSVTGPLGERISATYGILKDKTAVIEMAAASGLTLVPEDKRNPLFTTSYGTGELILAALGEGCRKIIIGIGGSATNDGGLGMAQALGVSFLDKDGRELGFGGGELSKLDRIDTSRLDNRIKNTEILVACDVTNPLYGENGATFVYGPQKGATPETAKLLDRNLQRFAEVIFEQLGREVAHIPGAGAAGGLGASLMAFCNAHIRPGIETVLDAINIDAHLPGADLVITGEGRLDGQSVYGKVPVGVAKRAEKHNIPVFAVTGGMGAGALAVYDYGISAIMCTVNRPMPLGEAMAGASYLLEDAAERAMRMIKIGLDMKN